MKEPWHGTSECSFKLGLRIGKLAGRLQALREERGPSPFECSFSQGYRMGEIQGKLGVLQEKRRRRPPAKRSRASLDVEIERLTKKQKAWLEGRPK